MLQTILLVVHILLAIGLIGLILLQQGQGATTGAAFGSGASTTVFGARGSGSFLTRATAILAILFLANSLFLAYRSSATLHQQSLMDRVQIAPATTEVPQPANDLPPGADEDSATLPATAPATPDAAALAEQPAPAPAAPASDAAASTSTSTSDQSSPPASP